MPTQGEPDRDNSARPPADPPTLDAPASTEVQYTAEARTIGPYVLLRKLGEGGMGQVWLAEQKLPLQRLVALKLVRSGLFEKDVVQRFLAERQSLAIMNHRAIAKVFDAGTTPEGQPYFVMEYVPGLPITQYCNQKRLNIRARLQLFIKVCEGVQHAHQKAIIHRDLKPANILVVDVDGHPEPRIIDFGIAKSIAPLSAEETMLTQTVGLLGTPGYMSPEQADPSLGDVDTRSDVYSLGAILYALLTDASPFDFEKWRKRPLVEMLRHLREDDPPSPSTVVTKPATRDALADARATQPGQLVRELRGDLDWITMKALDRERSRRYGTASELAADIERHLENQPVLARPASVGYRLRKYVARNRAAVAGVAGLILLLAGFGVTQAVQLRRITRERDRADRVAGFMTDMFKVSDPSEARGNTITAREILDRSSAQIDRSLAKDAELRARMMNVMGSVYQNLGLHSKSESLLEHALEIQRRTLGEKDPATLSSMNLLARAMALQGRYPEAETLARRTVDLSRDALGPRNAQTLKVTNTLVFILISQARLDEAETLARQNLETARAVLGLDDVDMARYIATLSIIETDRTHFTEAEDLLRQALDIQTRAAGVEHPDSLRLMNNLAVIASESGNPAKAEPIQRNLVEIERRILGPEHPETLGATSNLANYISDQERYAESVPLYQQTLAVQTRLFGPTHPDTLRTMDNLANALSLLGRRAEAEKLLREILKIRLQKFGAQTPESANTAYNLACLLALDNRRDEAFTYLRQSLDFGLPVRTGLAIEKDPDLKSLHHDPRFQAIVALGKQRAHAEQVSAKQ
jgi:non-specific serine/threonine protein kinase/serine/threonine-protein kinase